MNIQTVASLSDTAAPVREVDIELLALDLASCTRCLGTLANVEAAIGTLRQVLDATGTAVRLRKTLIESEEQARRHRFEASPTIRVNGRDIAFETRVNRCDSCTDLCGCEEGTDCRVWLYHGQEHTEAPVGLVVEAVLHGVFGEASPSTPEPAAPESVPENLRRFFAGGAAKAEQAVKGSACCSPAEQGTCCEPEAKPSCCGSAEAAPTLQRETCRAARAVRLRCQVARAASAQDARRDAAGLLSCGARQPRRHHGLRTEGPMRGLLIRPRTWLVVVLGNSGGGKSTLSRQLAARFDLPCTGARPAAGGVRSRPCANRSCCSRCSPSRSSPARSRARKRSLSKPR